MPDRPYRQSIARFADTLADQEQGIRTRWRRGRVKTVTPGASVDLRAAVVVTVNLDDIPAPYYDSYTPTVGDLVDVRFDDGSPIITGHVVGLPVV